jgi:hypothetical protein
MDLRARVATTLGIVLLATLALSTAAHAQPAFGTALTLGLGTPLRRVVVGDLNRDGRPDLVVASPAGTISILLASGPGTFGAPTTFALASPRALALEDVNRDGILDLVVAAGDGVSVLLGNGAGGFGARLDIPTGIGTTAVAIADLNGDGRPDIVVANGDSTLTVLLGDGAGGFALVADVPTGSTPIALALADVTGDGLIDVVVANAGDPTVSVFPGTGAGILGPRRDFATLPAAVDVAVVDLDFDGFPDLVVASSVGAVSVLRGAGGGTFRPATTVATGGIVQSVIAVDVNGDGRPDLVLARSTPAAALVLLGDGEGNFDAGTAFVNGGPEPFSIAAGDFNQDGRPDLVTANLAGNSVTVRFNTTVFAPAGAFAPAVPQLLSFSALDPQPVTILLGNVDNVTRTFTEFFDRTGPDLVVVEDAQASLALSFEGRIGGFPSPFPVGGGVTAAVLADVNRDGILDLVLGRQADSGVITALLGDGAGGFGPGIETPSFQAPISIAVGDVNRDGLPDLMIATGDLDGVLKFAGGAGAGFGADGLVLCGGGGVVRAVALADLNRDGILDIVAARGDSTVSVCLGNATGGFGPPINRAVGQFPVALAIGDVNGDGRLDVVVANADDGTVSILLGDGTGALPSRLDIPTGALPSAVALADLNRNGRLDIVVLNFGDENLRIIPDGGAAPSVLLDAGPGPFAFTIGDLNRDGRPDIAVVSTDRQVRVLLNDAPAAGGAITVSANPTIPEGFTVTLFVRRTSATLPATVSYAVGGSAVFGVDYELRVGVTTLTATGTLSFDVGETQKTINVRTINDGAVGPDTTLVFTLSAPVGATLGSPSQVTTTIIEADEALSFTQAIYAASEGSAAVATVVRRGDLQGTVTVRFTALAGSATAGSDFVAATGILTFAPGVASQSFPVATRADALRERDETVLLTLSEARSSQPPQLRTIRLEAPSAAQVTIADANAARFRFSAATATVAEGASISATVLRTGALDETATVTYAPTFISATAADVTLTTPLTLTFGPGVTSQTIALSAINDALVEGPETFQLTLVSATSNGRPAQIGTPASMVVTIVDNESAFGFAEGVDLVLPETATTATFTVVRTGGTGTTATVQVRTLEGAGGGDAVPDQDYRVVPLTTLTFAPGTTSRTFTVPLVNDTVNDGSKRLVVQLSNPTGGVALGTQRTAAALLQDDDDGGVIQWSRAATTVAEAAGSAALTVVRAPSLPGRHLASGVTVGFAVVGGTATNGTDYTLAQGTLTFGANETTKIVVVPVANDTLDEPDETVVVVLSNLQGGATVGALRLTTLTITDNDAGGVLQFAAAASTAPETAASTTLRVTRSGGLAGGVTVDFAVTGGTAINGIDYTLTAGTLTFEAGQTSRDITVTLRTDTSAEGPETVLVTLSNPTGGATLGPLQTATLTIVDDEAAVGFSLPAFSVTEATAAATITVVRTGPLTQPASVVVRTVDATGGGNVAIPGVDYLPLPPTTVTFPAGMASRTVTVAVLNDARRDGPRTVALALSQPSAGLVLGTQRTTALTILDDDVGGVIQFSADTFTAVEATGRATLTLTRTGGRAGGASATFVARFLSRFGSATRTSSGVVTFGPGQATQTIVLALGNDTLDRDERALVELGDPTGGATIGNRQRALLVVTDSSAGGVLRFTTSAVTALEGSTALLTVTRTGGLAGGVTVSFFTFVPSAAVNGLDFVLAPGVLVFEQGETTKTIAVPILGDALLEGPETFVVNLSNPSGGATLGTPSSATITILDAEAVVGFALPSLTISEGAASATVTVLRSGPLTSTATVQFRTVEGVGGGSAVPDVDYRAVPLTTLTFPAGMGSRTVTVPLLNDTAFDGQRFINLELSNPSAGLALGTTARRMSIGLTDDEGFGRVEFAAPAFFASESAGVATVRLVRSLASPSGKLGSGARVDIVVTGGSATNGVDYTLATGTVTFEAGETTKTFTFPIASDGVAEGPETITLQLQNASGGAGVGPQNTTTVTIFD